MTRADLQRTRIFEAINNERNRQDEKFKDNPLHHSPYIGHAVLSEEVGEVAKAILEGDLEQLRAELVQVAAVAIAMLESRYELGQ